MQPFDTDADALLFATTQFSRYQEVEEFVRENFERADEVQALIRGREGVP